MEKDQTKENGLASSSEAPSLGSVPSFKFILVPRSLLLSFVIALIVLSVLPASQVMTTPSSSLTPFSLQLLPSAYAQSPSYLTIFTNETYVIPGEGVSATVILSSDPDDVLNTGIANKTITLTGNGTDYLNMTETITTDGSGQAVVDGLQPLNITNKSFELTAHFAGDGDYDASNSTATFYYTVDSNALRIPITIPDDGSPVSMSVPGFDDNPSLTANVTFGSVQAPVSFESSIVVGECSSSSIDQDLFMALANSDGDICLRIYPNNIGSFYLANNAKTTASISYDGANLGGGSEDDVEMFFTDSFESTPNNDNIYDFTISRDTDANIVAGNSSEGQGDFMVGLGIHPGGSSGTVTKYLFVGDGQEVNFRNVTDTTNQTATLISVSPSTFSHGQQVTVKISYPNANLDATAIDSLSAELNTTSSDPTITVNFEETGIDTGEFTGTFTAITSGTTGGNSLRVQDGDTIQVWPELKPFTGRFKAVLDGITQAGVVEMSDFIFDPTELPNLAFDPIIEPVNMTLVDAERDPAGEITVTMSWANALVGNVSLSNLSVVKMFHQPTNQGWTQVANETLSYDNGTMTVTGTTTSDGLFVLAFNTGIGGGAGGGGFTGRGVVVDFVAHIAKSSSGGGGGGSGGGSSTTTNTNTGSNTVFVGQLVAGSNIQLDAIVQPSSSTINLQFENVETPGNISVEQKSLASLATAFSEVTDTTGKVIFEDGLTFTTAGNIFEIVPSDGFSYQGTIDVTIPYDKGMLGNSSSSDVRLLHFDGNVWEDVTIAIDEDAGTVTGRLTSLSPVVAAVANDGTFGSAYFQQNPLSKVIDVNQTTGSKFSDSDSPLTLLYSDGLDLSNVNSIKAGSNIVIVNSIKNLQRATQPYTYVLEIFDKEGIVIELQQVKSGSLAQGQALDITIDWTTPEQKGEYLLKIFLLDDLGSQVPQLLKNSISTNIGVT